MKKLVIVSLSMLFGVGIFLGSNPVPELISYIDDGGIVEIEEDETPLSAEDVGVNSNVNIGEEDVPL